MPIAPRLRADQRVRTSDLARGIATLARNALKVELELTPKPGLVDRANSGAHRDMDVHTMRTSIVAIAPWFPRFFARGVGGCRLAGEVVLSRLRADGIACERAMFDATGGVNTHKGAIFSLGVLCAAAGRLHGRGRALADDAVCDEVAEMTVGLVERELAAAGPARTAGERLYRTHGFTGVRGEAQRGFDTARRHGVAVYRHAHAGGATEERALLEALLALMAHNVDTNLVSRGGLDGLAFVQAAAAGLLARPWPSMSTRIAQLAHLDRAMIARNLSPGGSADLLAVSWFLANLEALTCPTEPRTSHHEPPHDRPRYPGAAGSGFPLRFRARTRTVQQRPRALAIDLGS